MKAPPLEVEYIASLDYYHLLGVSPEATELEIKKAHKRMAKKVHPDVNPDHLDWATHQVQLINAAYAVLSKPHLRLAYDRERWKNLAKSRLGSGQVEMEVEMPNPGRIRRKSPDRIIAYAFLAMFGLMIVALFVMVAVDAILKGLGSK